MCGIIGRNVLNLSGGKYKIKRISGLDPAGPGFYPPAFAPPLSSRDAEFVDIIHSDTFWIGTGISTGDVDFYPNNGEEICGPKTQLTLYILGTLQPGCPPIRILGLKHFLRSIPDSSQFKFQSNS